MNYKHFSLVERYQIYALMKAGHDQTRIAKLMDRHKSIISLELSRDRGHKGYRPKQACATAARVITLKCDNGKEFAAQIQIHQTLNSTSDFA